MRKLCQYLGVSRSGYYEWEQTGKERKRLKQLADQELLKEIRAVYDAYHGIFGYRKIFFKLKDKGVPCTDKRVHKLMKKHGIRSRTVRRFKPQTTKADPSHKAFDNLLEQNFAASAPGKVWVGDITYIKLGGKWVYLAVVIDLYRKRPVGWALSHSPNAQLVCAALKDACAKERPRKGLIFHSDRGSQYTSNSFKDLLKTYGMRGSMSRKGNPYDNAVAESFFRALKCEWVNHCQYTTLKEAFHSIHYYIEVFFRYFRPHQALGYKTPEFFDRVRKLAV